MLSFIANLFGSTFIGGLLDRLSDAYKAKLAADTDEKKVAAEVAIKSIEAELQVHQNAKEIRLATAGFFEMRAITFLIASPFVLHLWAVGLDTVFRFGWGIPKFPVPFDDYEGTILLSFFGVQAANVGLKSLAYIFGKRK